MTRLWLPIRAEQGGRIPPITPRSAVLTVDMSATGLTVQFGSGLGVKVWFQRLCSANGPGQRWR